MTPLRDGSAIVTGGVVAEGSATKATAQVLLFDPRAAKFVELPPLKHARFGHEATLLPGRDGLLGTSDDEILVTGGYDESQLLDSVELIRLAADPAQVTVSTLAPLPSPRSGHRALLVPLGRESGVLVTGGFVPVPGDRPRATSSAVLYRVRGDDAFAVRVSQPRLARFDHAAILLPGPDGAEGTDDDRVLVWGGEGREAVASDALESALGPVAAGEVYEPAFDRWTPIRVKDGLLPSTGFARPRRGVRAALVQGGGALLVGGTDLAGGVRETLIIELDARDAGVATLSPGAPLTFARGDAEVARLEDGRIVVAGGLEPGAVRVRGDAEVFSPNGRMVEPPIPLGTGRVHHGLAALGGQVLLLGGFDDASFARPTAGLLLLRR